MIFQSIKTVLLIYILTTYPFLPLVYDLFFLFLGFLRFGRGSSVLFFISFTWHIVTRYLSVSALSYFERREYCRMYLLCSSALLSQH